MVTTAGAAGDKQLQRVKGVVGYQQTSTTAFTTVVGRFLLPDDYSAVTRAKSAAILTLPDSSIVGLGENTDVQVGVFNQTTDGPGSTVTVNNGTLRFDIRRPQGGTANYHFSTTTTQIAVRGTVGLLSFVNGTTTVACVTCAADSVTVTVGTQTFTLLTGQLLTISAAGVVVAGALTAVAMGSFAGAGVSTSAASGASAATAGVAGGAAAGAATTAVAAGVAAAAAATTAIVSASQASPSPSPTPTPTGSGAIAVSGKTRVTAAPSPSPPAAPAGPRAIPLAVPGLPAAVTGRR